MKTLNIDNFYLNTLFILSILLVVFSCRQIPEEEKLISEDTSNIAPENLALVSINVTGTEWENQTISVNPDEQGVSALGGGVII